MRSARPSATTPSTTAENSLRPRSGRPQNTVRTPAPSGPRCRERTATNRHRFSTTASPAACSRRTSAGTLSSSPRSRSTACASRPRTFSTGMTRTCPTPWRWTRRRRQNTNTTTTPCSICRYRARRSPDRRGSKSSSKKSTSIRPMSNSKISSPPSIFHRLRPALSTGRQHTRGPRRET